MIDYTLPAVLVLWFVVMVRVVGVMRGGSRLLALILVLLVTMFTIKLSFVGPTFDRATGTVGFSVWLRDSVAVVAGAICAHATTQLARVRPSPRWSVIATVIAVLGAMIGMAAFFAATGPAREGIVQITEASGEWPALGFMLFYLVPYGSFLLMVVIPSFIDARRPGPWNRSRRGLMLFGIGATFGVLFVIAKLVILANVHRPWVLQHQEALLSVPSLIAVVCIAAGAATWTEINIRERYLFARLHSAHRSLTRGQSVPRIVWRGLSVSERLDRRAIEIGEAITRHQDAGTSTANFLPQEPPASDPAELLRQVLAARRQHRRLKRITPATEVLSRASVLHRSAARRR